MFHPDSKLDTISHSPIAAAVRRAHTTRRLPDAESKTMKVGNVVETTEQTPQESQGDSIDNGSMGPTFDHTRRKLKPRHIQLIGIGGTIGTALYVQIGSGLRTSGPASLFLAVHSLVSSMISNFVDIAQPSLVCLDNALGALACFQRSEGMLLHLSTRQQERKR